ncbi:MAG: MFS transporter [bacterium]|nr:MFS transporter [bacterium]
MGAVVKPRSQTVILMLAFVAFISLGLPDGLLSIAGPDIRESFRVGLDRFGLVFVTGTIGYFLSSIASGWLTGRLGVGRLLALSCACTAAALLGYTLAPGWWAVVLLGLLSGAGAGAIDAGLNNYIAANHSDGLMQWLHASFGVGTTIGPLIMTTVLAQELSWRWGYIIVGGAQLALATCFFLTAEMWQGNPQAPKAEQLQYKTPVGQTLRIPAAWMSIAIFFLYTGLEAGTGAWAYSLFTQERGIAEETAGLWVAIYWGVFTIGRITAGIITGRIGITLLLRLSMIGALLATMLFTWNPFPASGAVALAILGFSLAPIFPGLVSTTAARVGVEHASNTIGFQIGIASVGMGILTALVGVMANAFSDGIGLEVLGPFQVVVAALILILHELTHRHTRR